MFIRIEHEVDPFDTYFKEADDEDTGDKVSVSVAPRQNRGTDYGDDSTTVNGGPRANRGTDYNKEDEPPPPPETDDEGTDYSDNDDPPPADDDNDNGDENTDSDNEDNNTENDGGDGGTDGGGDEPEMDDEGTDYSDGSGDDDTNTDGDNNDDNNDDEEDEKEDPDEQRKRYAMYLKYNHLLETIDKFKEKLQNVVKDEPSENAVITKVNDNLREMYDALSEYMIMNFSKAKYVEILVFYETVFNCIRLNFELIRNNKIILKQ